VVSEVMWAHIVSNRQMAALLAHTYPYIPDSAAMLAAAAALHAPLTCLPMPARHYSTFATPAGCEAPCPAR
jgi:hypothetical protein